MDSPASEIDLHLDLTEVLARFGDDPAFAVECAELLEAELPGMVDAMRQAVRLESADGLHRAAHTLKGAISNFCETGPTKTAARIDALARDGQLAAAGGLIDVLERELAGL